MGFLEKVFNNKPEKKLLAFAQAQKLEIDSLGKINCGPEGKILESLFILATKDLGNNAI